MSQRETAARTDARAAAGSAPRPPLNPISTAYLWVVGLKGWPLWAFAAGTGLISNLAFPPIGFWPALSLGLSALVWLLDGAKLAANPGKSAFWRVWTFGFGYFLGGFYWDAAAFLTDPAFYVFIWLPVTLLPAGLSLFWAAGMRLGFVFWWPGPARLIVFSVFFMLSEWVRGHIFGGLPWNLPGMAWEAGGAISQSASVWGVYGLSLLTVVFCCAPAGLADSRPRGSAASRAALVALSIAAMTAIWGWGSHRLAQKPVATPVASSPRVRLIEAGVPQSEKYDNASAELLLKRYLDLSGPPPTAPRDAGNPSILIWPEGALPFYLFEWPDALDVVSERLGPRRLIIGLARREQANTPKEKAYNSLAVLDATANMKGALTIYDKHMLVPFGEFTPFRELAAMVGIPTLQALAKSGFFPGARPSTQSAVGVPPFGPLICYEAIFPGLSPRGEDRPRWLVNISNDSWFGHLSGPYQHSAQARMRAIEEGLPMARVASGGESGMIDGHGRWTVRATQPSAAVYGPDPKGWTAHVADAEIPPALARTLYSRFGDLLFYAMMAAINLGLLALPRK